MMNTIDTFVLPGYETQDNAPATVANENQRAAPTHTIPPVVWMIVFLAVGYIGLRSILED